MAWTIILNESVLDDLRWFGKKEGRLLLHLIEERLYEDPTTESKSRKVLRPNQVAQRELRLSGKYRVLFNVDEGKGVVTIVAIGEKRGNTLLVQGEEYSAHHEDHSIE